MITLSDVLDEAFKHAKFDKAMADAVYRFQVAYLNRDREHLAFFGSNLLGVHVIRWRVKETVQFFHDVCGVDAMHLEREIRRVTTIVHEYVISSDPLNLTMMYLIHRFLTSGRLTDKQRERAAYDTALVFFYRCIAIRQSDYFHFPADPKLAQAAYARLSNKFLIKQEGTWKKVMEYRAKALLDPKASIHYKALVSFTDDGATAYAISDSENRVRELYKNYYQVFEEVRTDGTRIHSASSTQIDVDGEETLKEKVKSTEQYINYIRQAIIDKEGFVRQDLVKVITDINTNTSQRILLATLGWLSDSYNDLKWHKKIDEWLGLIIVHSFHLLDQVNGEDSKHLPKMLTTLKNLYLSTRSTDPDLLKIRKIGDELIKAANGSVNNSLAMATRTATILYITLRAITAKAM